MKAEIKPRIELVGRTRLEEVIPLDTPFVLFVDPANMCNFRCKYCPTGDPKLIRSTGRKQGLFDFGLFEKLIGDLAAFEKPLRVLRLYKEGEPLIHPRFVDMVRLAKQSGLVDRVDTTSNGSLLNPKLNRALVDAGLDRINISLEGMNAKVYREFAGYRIQFDRFVANIRDLYENRGQCEVLVKVVSENLAPEEHELFYQTFGDIADRVFIENMAPCWPEFDTSHLPTDFEEGIYGQSVSETEVCPYPFYSIAVNSDGSVSLCFLDWARKLPIGNVRDQSLKSIWESERLYRYRRMMLTGNRRKNPTCAVCGQLSHCLPDNIDAHAAGLLEKLDADFQRRLPARLATGTDA
ncbi:MAG: radical SAM protein [Gammaproteobacteria bacterium]